jgi:hypothetical protein
LDRGHTKSLKKVLKREGKKDLFFRPKKKNSFLPKKYRISGGLTAKKPFDILLS